MHILISAAFSVMVPIFKNAANRCIVILITDSTPWSQCTVMVDADLVKSYSTMECVTVSVLLLNVFWMVKIGFTSVLIGQ